MLTVALRDVAADAASEDLDVVAAAGIHQSGPAVALAPFGLLGEAQAIDVEGTCRLEVGDPDGNVMEPTGDTGTHGMTLSGRRGRGGLGAVPVLAQLLEDEEGHTILPNIGR